MSFMFNRRRGLFIGLLLLVFFFSQNYALASGQEHFEWELRVIVEKAKVHLEPDENSTVTMTVPQTSTLRSYEKEGEWFRVIFQQESRIVVIGYIHSSQVKVMKEKVNQKIDFWGEESDFFKGIGLGFSYVQWGSKSWLLLADSNPPKRLDSTPRVKALPVRLGTFVTLPIFRKINVTFNA